MINSAKKVTDNLILNIYNMEIKIAGKVNLL